MPHYKSNLRDLEFNLFEVFGAGERLGTGPYHDMHVDTARDILREVERLATGTLAEPFADADRHPPVTRAAYSSWRTLGVASVGGPTGVFDATQNAVMAPLFPTSGHLTRGRGESPCRVGHRGPFRVATCASYP